MKNHFTPNCGSITCKQIDQIITILNVYHPINILEYGAGVSTQVFQEYCKENNASLTTIEHDKTYHYSNNVYFNLNQHGNVTINSCTYNDVCIYEHLDEWMNNCSSKFDMVFIDGPFGYLPQYYTRIQMVYPLLYNRLSDEGIFLIHDSERPSSQRSQQILEHLFTTKGYSYEIINYPASTKQLTIIMWNKNIL